MKKLLLALTFVFLLSSCGDTETPDTPTCTNDQVLDNGVCVDPEPVIEIEVVDFATFQFDEYEIDAYYTVTIDGVEVVDPVVSIIDNSSNEPDTYSITVSYQGVTERILHDVLPIYGNNLGQSSYDVEYASNLDLNDYFQIAHMPSGVQAVFNSSAFSGCEITTLGTKTCQLQVIQEGVTLVDETVTLNIVDTIAPEFTINSSIEYRIGDPIPTFSDFVTAVDNYDGDVISSLSFGFDINDYLTPGTYTVTLTVSDSSGNETTKGISLEVIGLYVEEVQMFLDIANGLQDLPTPIEYEGIGTFKGLVPNVDPTSGNGYMDDNQTIYYNDFNVVTTDKYIDMVNTYNSSVGNTSNYLASVLPLLVHITELDREYTVSGFTLIASKNIDDQYVVDISGDVLGIPTTYTLTIDSYTVNDEFTFTIDVTVASGSYQYQITRDIDGIVSLQEIASLSIEGYNVVRLNYYTFDDDGIQGFSYKDDVVIQRRMYFNYSEDKCVLYYENDQTGSVNIQVFQADGTIVFEYEDYMPNVPLVGTEKARWFLTGYNDFNNILYEESGLLNTTKEYTINSTTIDHTDTFMIEVKNYTVIEYDSIGQTHTGVTAPTWVLRVEGELDTGNLSNFDYHNIFVRNNTVDVDTLVSDVDTLANTIQVLEVNANTVTTQDILDYLTE